MSLDHRLPDRVGEDPPGHRITAVPGGYRWTRSADGWTSPVCGTREQAVAEALADEHAPAVPGDGGPQRS